MLRLVRADAATAAAAAAAAAATAAAAAARGAQLTPAGLWAAAADTRKGVGLKLRVDAKTGAVEVGEIEKGTSAWQSPLNIGDRIAMIDGVPVRGKGQRQLAADLLGPDGTTVELRVEHENSSENGIGLCASKRSHLKVIKLVRGSAGAVEEEEEDDDVLQVRVDETQNCAGSMSLGLLCMPTEHILYVFSLRLQGHRWQVCRLVVFPTGRDARVPPRSVRRARFL